MSSPSFRVLGSFRARAAQGPAPAKEAEPAPVCAELCVLLSQSQLSGTCCRGEDALVNSRLVVQAA